MPKNEAPEELWRVLLYMDGVWVRGIDEEKFLTGSYDYCRGWMEGARCMNRAMGIKIEMVVENAED